MAKVLIKAFYTTEGTKGVVKEGGSSRRAAVQKTIESVGGKLEAFYFALGDADAFVICDVPDLSAAVAISLSVNASGAVRTTTTPLLTPEELDAAAKKSVSYRAPGV